MHINTPLRTLEESSIRDGSGELTVGGIGGVSDSFFTGALQDVRVYADSLDLKLVDEGMYMYIYV